jgi:hypothetical protein
MLALVLALESAVGATNLVETLSAAANHYEWVRVSREIERVGVTVPKSNTATLVRHRLVQLSARAVTNREPILAEIVAIGPPATPTLINAITNAARPAPIFGDSAVANIPIFSMQLLARMKSPEAVPALIDFIDKFETDVGDPKAQVAGVLHAVTGENFGTNQAQWRKWYERTKKIP